MGIYLCKQFLSHSGADCAQLMRDIARYTEPVRPGRQDQRNLKIKAKNVSLKNLGKNTFIYSY